MARFLKVDLVGEPLKGVKARMKDRARPFRLAIQAWRAVIRQEFQREAWNRPSGGFRAWPRTEAFGDQPRPRKTLQRTGALLRAYMGEGPGAIVRQGPDSVVVGVSGAVLPYAAVHRGSGRVLSADAAQPARIPVTPRMRVFLGMALGVWLKKETKYIVIQRRPHATANPEIRTRVAAIFSAHLAGRPVPAGVLR